MWIPFDNIWIQNIELKVVVLLICNMNSGVLAKIGIPFWMPFKVILVTPIPCYCDVPGGRGGAECLRFSPEAV